ncbi:MAG: hypothetical protein ACKOWJ_03700 [Micrococcales bacterium]
MNFKPDHCEPDSLFDFVGDARRLIIRTSTHPSVSLVAPLIGEDFIAGIAEHTGLWCCIRSNQIQSLIAQSAAELTLPEARVHPGDLAALLTSLTVPMRMQLHEQIVVVSRIQHGWAILAGSTFRAIPLAAITELALLDAPDEAMAVVAA